MSRGGTKKARSAQQQRRKSQERQDATVAKQERKRQDKENAPKKGKAALLHLSGIPAPMVLAITLWLSGPDASNNPDRADSMLSSPLDLLALAGLFIVVAGVFWLTPVMIWKRIYRNEPFVKWDFSAVDSTFTLLVAAAVTWLARAVFGYTDWIDVTTSVLLTMSLYLPVFSAVLAMIMPAVPGGFRVGGVLPGPMRIPFTKMFLLTDEQKEDVAAYETMAKAHRSRARS